MEGEGGGAMSWCVLTKNTDNNTMHDNFYVSICNEYTDFIYKKRALHLLLAII